MGITVIIGKRSYLSMNLNKNISNSYVFSIRDIKKIKKFLYKKKNINIIYNHSNPISKLNTTNNYSEIIKKNILSLDNFINFLIINEINIKTFIFSSSASVYNINLNKNKIDYFDHNKSIYGACKFLMEKLLIYQKKKLNCNLIIARIFNIYGPNEINSLISKIIYSKKMKKKFQVFSKNNSFRDYIHIEDVIMIYKFFLKKKLSGIFDVGTGKSIDVKRLIKKYFKPNEIKILSNKNFLTEVKFSRANINYLKSVDFKINLNKVYKFIDSCII